MASKGAIRAAAVIMEGRKILETDYGKKNAEGIAELIDDKTGASALLSALKRALEAHKHPGEDYGWTTEAEDAIRKAEAD